MEQERTTIIVRNLDEKVSEEILYELFLQAGPLEEVRIPMVNGVPRNFGIVVYTHEESVPYAINLLDKTVLYGRPIHLKDGGQNRPYNFLPRAPQRSHIKERLGPRPMPDSSSLRAAPGFGGRRYNDLSMQPSFPSKHKDRNEDNSRHHNAWTQPGALNLYPSQKSGQIKDQNPTNGHFKHRNRNDHGGFSQSRKPYEKPSHQRDNSRYDRKHFRRSK